MEESGKTFENTTKAVMLENMSTTGKMVLKQIDRRFCLSSDF